MYPSIKYGIFNQIDLFNLHEIISNTINFCKKYLVNNTFLHFNSLDCKISHNLNKTYSAHLRLHSHSPHSLSSSLEKQTTPFAYIYRIRIECNKNSRRGYFNKYVHQKKKKTMYNVLYNTYIKVSIQ